MGQTPLNYAEETRANEEGSTHFASIASTNSRRAARATPAPSASPLQLPTHPHIAIILPVESSSPSSSSLGQVRIVTLFTRNYSYFSSSSSSSSSRHTISAATTSTLRRSCLLSRDAECRGSSAATTTSPETVVTFKRRPQYLLFHRPRRRGRTPPHQIFPPKPGSSTPEFILFPFSFPPRPMMPVAFVHAPWPSSPASSTPPPQLKNLFTSSSAPPFSFLHSSRLSFVAVLNA